jgi:hypothetical protein
MMVTMALRLCCPVTSRFVMMMMVMVVAMTIFLRFCYARLYRGLFFRPRCRDKGRSECLRHNNRSTASAGRRRQAIRCHAHLQDLSFSRKRYTHSLQSPERSCLQQKLIFLTRSYFVCLAAVTTVSACDCCIGSVTHSAPNRKAKEDHCRLRVGRDRDSFD